MKLYRIANWPKWYEVSDSKKVSGPLQWVPVRTKTDGFGYARITSQPNRCELLAAWYLMLGVAAKQPRESRGTLARDGVPLTADDLALITRFPSQVFEDAFVFFSDPRQRWLVSEDVRIDSDESEGDTEPSESSGSTGQDSRGQDSRGQDSLSSSPSPAAPSDDQPDSKAEPSPDESDQGANRKSVPFQEIVALYNELCPSLPKAQLTDNRRKPIRARWLDRTAAGDENPIDWFRLLFTKAEASDFLSGRRPGSGNVNWRCGFDWLTGPKNAPKVIEGNYDNIEAKPQLGRFGQQLQ